MLLSRTHGPVIQHNPQTLLWSDSWRNHFLCVTAQKKCKQNSRGGQQRSYLIPDYDHLQYHKEYIGQNSLKFCLKKKQTVQVKTSASTVRIIVKSSCPLKIQRRQKYCRGFSPFTTMMTHVAEVVKFDPLCPFTFSDNWVNTQ